MGTGRAAGQGNAAKVVPQGGGGCAGQQAGRPGAGPQLTHPLPVPSSAWWEETLGRREVDVDTSADLSSGSRSGGPLRYSCVPCRVLLNILNSLPRLKKARDFPSKSVFWLLMTDWLELSGSCLRRWGTRSSKPQAPPGPPQFHPLPGPVAACMLVTHSLGCLLKPSPCFACQHGPCLGLCLPGGRDTLS